MKDIATLILFTLIVQPSLAINVLCTTTIGAYPKPEYITLSDWFGTDQNFYKKTEQVFDEYNHLSNAVQKMLDFATVEAVKQQISLGIDYPTDGEIRRENYIHYHCRHLNGIDFAQLQEKSIRNGACTIIAPKVTGPVTAQAPFLPDDYKVAQTATARPVKITIPGPLTITDSVVDNYYFDAKKLGAALAKAINVEVKRLVAAGCTWIQIDEPLFARKPDQARAYGIKNLERCFKDVPEQVTRVVHICCGYRFYLDQENYEKADPQAYADLALALDKAHIDAISIEDSHRRNSPKLFAQFKNKIILLGVIDVSASRVETVEEIENHIRDVLRYIPAQRLMIAPDCGLGFLPQDILKQKLKNMVTARNQILAALS